MQLKLEKGSCICSSYFVFFGGHHIHINIYIYIYRHIYIYTYICVWCMCSKFIDRKQLGSFDQAHKHLQQEESARMWSACVILPSVCMCLSIASPKRRSSSRFNEPDTITQLFKGLICSPSRPATRRSSSCLAVFKRSCFLRLKCTRFRWGGKGNQVVGAPRLRIYPAFPPPPVLWH